MGHDAEFVQGRLSIEEHDVSIDQVPLHDVTESELLSDLLTVSIF